MRSALLTSLLFIFPFPPFSLFFFLFLVLNITIINNSNNERNAFPELVPKMITPQFALLFWSVRKWAFVRVLLPNLSYNDLLLSAPAYTTNVRNRQPQLDGTGFSSVS